MKKQQNNSARALALFKSLILLALLGISAVLLAASFNTALAVGSDFDGDGIPDLQDNCPTVFNPNQQDTDGDGIGDACDNCPSIPNPGQEDSNNNGIGDACESASSTVINTNDSGAGSLRQALVDASDGDTIDFSVTTPATITLTSGELLVDKNVTISGPGANVLAVNANAASRVFHIAPGKTVNISGLTITNGNPPANPPDNYGAGIYNDHATLTVSNCTISGNSTGDSGYGGGIYNDGFIGSATLMVNNSTLSGNSADVYGGGIFNDGQSGSATVTVNNSTISGNAAGFVGGGIFNIGYNGSATLTINSSTLSDNSATVEAGGIANQIAVLYLTDTILNTGTSGANIVNYDGTVTSLGYNLSSDAAGGDAATSPGGFLNANGDIRNTDPMLGALQDNGGPTYTHALLSCSPAINRGDPSFMPPPDYDQRGAGYPRVVDGRVDIGSFEVQEVQPCYSSQIQQPINADGTSVFNVRRGVVPVKFTLTLNGVATCDLPTATIAVTRTAGGTTGPIDESVYTGSADTGSNFRIDSCQYVYNLSASGLGVGTYQVDIIINGQVVGSATFKLR